MIQISLSEQEASMTSPPVLKEVDSSSSHSTCPTMSTTGSSSSISSLSSLNSSSLKRSGSSSKNMTAGSKRFSLVKRKVRFTADEIFEVQCFKTDLEDEHKAELWYKGSDMAQMRKRQLKELKKSQAQVDLAALDEDLADARETVESASNGELTWRGFEDIQQGWCRVQKSSKYTRKVVATYEAQLEDCCELQVDDLRKVARSLSKDERARVRQVAVQDAKDVGMPFDYASDFKPRRRRDRSSEGIKKSSSFTGSLMSSLKKAGGSSLSKNTKGMRRNLSGGFSSLMKGMKVSSSKSSNSSLLMMVSEHQKNNRNATFTSSNASKCNAIFPVRSPPSSSR